jgi:hypothetical protein
MSLNVAIGEPRSLRCAAAGLQYEPSRNGNLKIAVARR